LDFRNNGSLPITIIVVNSVASLSTVISPRLLTLFQPGSGGRGEEDLDPARFNTTLRTGARVYGAVVQGLNSLLSFTHLADSSLTQLSKLTEKLEDLAERASLSSTGSDSRRKLNAEFKNLGQEFKKIEQESEVGTHNYLTKDGLSALFETMGLDPEKAGDVGEAFAKLKAALGDSSLASPDIEGEKPPGGAKRRDALFSMEAGGLKSRADSLTTLSDVQALKAQIKHNQKGLTDLEGVVTDNIDLVRAVGLTLLNVSESVSSQDSVEVVLLRIQDGVREQAGQFSVHVHNITPLTLKGLLFPSG